MWRHDLSSDSVDQLNSPPVLTDQPKALPKPDLGTGDDAYLSQKCTTPSPAVKHVNVPEKVELPDATKPHLDTSSSPVVKQIDIPKKAKPSDDIKLKCKVMVVVEKIDAKEVN